MKILVEKAVIERVLKALEFAGGYSNGHGRSFRQSAASAEAITALREALEQLNCQCGDKCFPVFSGDIEYCETCGKPTALAEQVHTPYCKQAPMCKTPCGNSDCVEQAEQEPVAYLRMGSDQRFVVTKAAEELVADTFHQLYAAPVRTKDLTASEIRDIWNSSDNYDVFCVEFARAVIAKYKEKNK